MEQDCKFPAVALRAYLDELSNSLDSENPFTADRNILTWECIEQLKKLKDQHWILTGCLCWQTRDELANELRVIGDKEWREERKRAAAALKAEMDRRLKPRIKQESTPPGDPA